MMAEPKGSQRVSMMAEPKEVMAQCLWEPVFVGNMLLPQAARAWDRIAGPGTSVWCPGNSKEHGSPGPH